MGEVFSLASEPSSLYVLIFEFLHTHTHTHTHKCGTDSLEQLVVILFYISFVVYYCSTIFLYFFVLYSSYILSVN